MSWSILTKHVLHHVVPGLVADGLNGSAIAARLGCKVSTLTVRCSQEQISLRRGGRYRDPYSIVRLNRAAMTLVSEHATKRGMTSSAIVTELIETIVRDNLYDAVLDTEKEAA